MTLRCRSAKTWISMWRGAATYFSISTRGSPKAAAASRTAPASAASNSACWSARPPLAPPAPPRHGLDQHRIADLVGLALEEVRLLVLAVIARHRRHAGPFHQRLGAILQPHGADRGRRRTDEAAPRGPAGLGEIGILGQEAVTRMEAAGAGLFRHRHQPVGRQIARRAERMGLVAQAH